MQSELPEDLALGDLEILRVLGEGNYGRVKLVLHKDTGFVLALKTLNKVLSIETRINNQKNYSFFFLLRTNKKKKGKGKTLRKKMISPSLCKKKKKKT